MEEAPSKYASNLAWVVLSRPVNGRSEVIKITNCEEADQAVLDNPEFFYKSGPVLLSWTRLARQNEIPCCFLMGCHDA